MHLVDTHVHLDDPQFSDPATVVLRALQADVCQLVCVATDAPSSHRVLALAQQFPEVFAAVGIHPNSCHEAREEDWQEIVRFCAHRKVVALGETGLDRYWNYASIEQQIRYFQLHLELSQQTGLPVVIHMRDSEEDIKRVLHPIASQSPILGVMHSFSGSWQLAEQCLAWGLYISLSGMVTYKKNVQLRDVAARIPEDRLLLETDAPYLSPEPVRGQRPNEPAMIRHTAQCVAEIRGITLEELAAQTTRNARRLFRLPEAGAS